VAFGDGKPVVDHIHLSFWGGDARLRFLLKSVEDVDYATKSNGIDRAPGITVKRRDDLHHRAAPEAFQRLRRRVGFALLRRIKGIAARFSTSHPSYRYTYKYILVKLND
jgi:hypothetical protein